MDASVGRTESDVYRLDIVPDEASALSSAADFAEEMINDDDLIDLSRDQEGHRSQRPADQRPAPRAQAQEQGHRPPPISTDWESDAGAANAGGDAGPGEEAEDAVGERENVEDARVAFNAPSSGSDAANFAAATAAPMIHFRNPKRYHNNYASPYPTQSLRQGNDGAADSASERVAAEGGRPANSRIPYGRNQRRGGAPRIPSEATDASLAEVTPAFLRRAAQDLGVASNRNAEAAAAAESGARGAVPPNTLMNLRHGSSTSSNNIMNSSIPDSSFYGADASALDGTFVSIRDLNDDDDVPSVDNDQWNSTTGKGAGRGEFPTETTSLLGRNVMMPWQGGFFGSQMEKEDRRERRRMRLRNRRGLLAGWVWHLRSMLSQGKSKMHADVARGAQWDANHPIGGGFASPVSAQQPGGGSSHQRAFSLFLTGALCFHMALCGIHDLFLRYLSYRNPEYGGEEEVSWNGEGKYLPAYWVSFDGRVLNPLIGPCARTLTAFGALVPGIVLSRVQVWRVGTSLFETSSLSQLMLHIWALKTAVGGFLTGLEWKRDTATVVLLYFISALIGSTWSIALEPGRLIATSGMGIAGLLAASMVEQACFPLVSKEDEDEADTSGRLNGSENVSNGISSSTNEQFTYQPSNSQKKRSQSPLTFSSPAFILALEVLASWLAAYSSLVGMVMAAVSGAACALLLFVGCPPNGCFDDNANRDWILSEEPPPPPPPKFVGDGWRDDDDSADTSIGASRQYNTPLMRRSILADDDDEEEPLGTRSILRRRYANGSSAKTPVLKGHMISIKRQKPFSASRITALVIGVLLKLLLTLVPASLIASGDGPSNEVTRASALGCRPMRILYKEDGEGDQFECAGGCIPLSRERVARWSEGMRAGRCDSIGYRCWQQSGTMTLRNYELNVGIYVVPSADGTCATATDDNGGEESSNNDDVVNAEALYNGEVEGVQ